MLLVKRKVGLDLFGTPPLDQAWALKATWGETREVLYRTLRTEAGISLYTSNSYSGTIASLQARGFVLEPLPSAVYCVPFQPVREGTGWQIPHLFARGYKLGCRPNADLLGTRTRLLSIRPGSSKPPASCPFERANLILTLRLMWTLRETALCPRVVPASMRGLSQKWLHRHQSNLLPRANLRQDRLVAGDGPRHGPGLGPRLPGALLLLRSARRRIPVVMCPAPLVALPGGPASWCAGTLTRRQPSQTLSWPLVPPLCGKSHGSLLGFS